MGDERNSAAFCPSCDRFIGPADACPYCESDSARSPVLRRLRVAALALAFIGLAFLYMAARSEDIPVVRISEITPAMNFARVKIVGTMKKTNSRFSGKSGRNDYFSFSLSDGSGTLRVVAYGDMAHRLRSGDNAPREGDLVEAVGSLDIANGKARLRLSGASRLGGGEAQETRGLDG